MPFLKPINKPTVAKLRASRAKRNGWRCRCYEPREGESNDFYKGQWVNDLRNGKGLEFKDEAIYEGDWKDNKRCGYGVLSELSKNGLFKKNYAGFWINNKKHGRGCQWYHSSYYEGDFCCDKRQGFGRLWSKTGSFYQGQWHNDLFHGDGLLVQENGNIYEGEFCCGKKHGSGKYYHLKTGQVQRGTWDNDRCISNTTEDITWRQSAILATPYPIPKIQLLAYAIF